MLTDAEIRRSKPKDKPYKLSDAEGLYLYIQPNGSRLWRMKYRFGGREKTLSFGKYPLVSLAGARSAKNAAKEELLKGRDPALTKRQHQAEAACTKNQLKEVGALWLAMNKDKWSVGHLEQVTRSLERFVWPSLGNIPITEITPPMVLAAIESVERASGADIAGRVRQRVSSIFTYGIARGLGTQDPAAIIKGALSSPIKNRMPAITDLAELRAAMQVIEAMPAHPTTLLAIRFLALTAVRPGEVNAMPWVEVDGDVWSIPPERMKMKRGHVVPLSRQALDVLGAAKILTGQGPMVFPNARWAHKPMSENAMSFLLKRAGFFGVHVPHGFRSSFSSIMNERRPEYRSIIDQMLAHASRNDVEAAYNRAEHRERRRALAQEWADILLDGFPSAMQLLNNARR